MGIMKIKLNSCNINFSIVLLLFSNMSSGALLEVSSIQNTSSSYTFPADDSYVYVAKVNQGNHVSSASDTPCTVDGVDDASWRSSNLIAKAPTHSAQKTVSIVCTPTISYAGKNYGQTHRYYQCSKSAKYITDCNVLFSSIFKLGETYHATVDYNPVIDITTGTGSLVNSISSENKDYTPAVYFKFSGKVCNDNSKCVPVSVEQNSVPAISDVDGNYRLTDATTLKVDWDSAEGGLYKSTGTLTLVVE